MEALSVQAIGDCYRNGARRMLFVLPTGGGKTVVFCHIISRIAAAGGRVLVLVHRRELLSQASASLGRLGVAHGLIQAGQPMDLTKPVQVASVQTVARRLDQIPPDLFTFVVVDEAHHSCATTWASVIKHFDTARLLGVTATPIRADGGVLRFMAKIVDRAGIAEGLGTWRPTNGRFQVTQLEEVELG